jgi:hypothetical protein
VHDGRPSRLGANKRYTRSSLRIRQNLRRRCLWRRLCQPCTCDKALR